MSAWDSKHSIKYGHWTKERILPDSPLPMKYAEMARPPLKSYEVKYYANAKSDTDETDTILVESKVMHEETKKHAPEEIGSKALNSHTV